MALADMFKSKLAGKSFKFSSKDDEDGDEPAPKSNDSKGDAVSSADQGDPVKSDEPGDEQPGDNGLALKHALDSGDGLAIEELIRKIRG
jgi:hypothetical protein